MKFLVEDQVGEMAGDQHSSQKYYVEMVRVDHKKARQDSAQSLLGGSLDIGGRVCDADNRARIKECPDCARALKESN